MFTILLHRKILVQIFNVRHLQDFGSLCFDLYVLGLVSFPLLFSGKRLVQEHNYDEKSFR